MKKRQAFVANSSSSSFIIGVKEIPKTFGDACNIFFGDKQELYAPAIIKGLFDGMKEFKIDFDRLLDMAKSLKQINNLYLEFPYCDDNDNLIDNEAWVLNQLSSNFIYGEEYGSRSYWSSAESHFKTYVDDAIEKNFPDVKCKYDVPWNETRKIENRFYRLKAVKERWVEDVEDFIKEMKGYGEVENTVFMMGEFSDDDSLGSKLEHGDHWDEFQSKKIFSHH